MAASAYQAARRGAAFIDRSARGRLLVSGRDRASYLQGLLTNDIVALKAGEGCYTAYLTAQGRMIADMWVYELGDVILLSTAGEVKDVVLAKLDQFIFSEDVQLGDVTQTFSQIAVVGPESTRMVDGLVGGEHAERLAALSEHANIRAAIEGQPAIVTRISDTGAPGFDLYVERAQAASVTARLMAAGAVEADRDTAEALRVEAGIPLFHRDMDEETIPLEAGIESRAISLTKGCYVGQEVIIRVLHRGHGRVAKKLVGLLIDDGSPPPPGSMVSAADRDVGHVTSSVVSPALGRPIALGYVHRDFTAPGTPVVVAGRPGAVAALPFVR
jgi:folate-binding protein YgfZ